MKSLKIIGIYMLNWRMLSSEENLQQYNLHQEVTNFYQIKTMLQQQNHYVSDGHEGWQRDGKI